MTPVPRPFTNAVGGNPPQNGSSMINTPSGRVTASRVDYPDRSSTEYFLPHGSGSISHTEYRDPRTHQPTSTVVSAVVGDATYTATTNANGSTSYTVSDGGVNSSSQTISSQQFYQQLDTSIGRYDPNYSALIRNQLPARTPAPPTPTAPQPTAGSCVAGTSTTITTNGHAATVTISAPGYAPNTSHYENGQPSHPTHLAQQPVTSRITGNQYSPEVHAAIGGVVPPALANQIRHSAEHCGATVTIANVAPSDQTRQNRR